MDPSCGLNIWDQGGSANCQLIGNHPLADITGLDIKSVGFSGIPKGPLSHTIPQSHSQSRIPKDMGPACMGPASHKGLTCLGSPWKRPRYKGSWSFISRFSWAGSNSSRRTLQFFYESKVVKDVCSKMWREWWTDLGVLNLSKVICFAFLPW